MTNFISLHNQTHYSLLDALPSPKDLLLKAKELGQSAVAITDHGVLAGTWEAFKAAKDIGVKLIIGCEMYFLDDLNDRDKKMKHIVLIAKNAIGYKNLLIINKLGYDNGDLLGKRVYPVISWDLLSKYSDGLICLTACGNGILSQPLMSKDFDKVESTLLKLKEIFKDNLGLEIQPNNMRRNATYYNEEIDQQFLNRQLINLGKKHDVRVVAACNSHYINKEQAETHDVLLAIGSHQPAYSNFRLKYSAPEFYLKTGDEIKSFFARNYGEESAQSFCDNSVYFADLCESPDWIDPKYSNPSGKELPTFPIEDEDDFVDFLQWKDEQSDDLKKMDEDQLFLRYRTFKYLPMRVKDITKEYYDRIEEELDVLNFCGVASYMLIVADIINWARSNGISVGPGRGSAGGCLVAFLLDIHKADSIKYGLVFPRFHNKLKPSYSDIDVDFSEKNRHKIIEYLIHKYGKDNVAQISNLIEITPKIYIKDIARACEFGGSREAALKIGAEIADMVPADVKSINKAMETIPLFNEYCKRYPELEKYKDISNKYRSFGIHASGVVITKRPLTGLIPLRKDKNDVISVEYDKDVSEENGLVKMDILGLSTLDLMDQAIELIKAAGKELNPDFYDYESSDEKTYDLISRGDTFGVFQFGTSGGTIDLCKKIKPKNIEDLAIITTLARPASKEIREEFINTRAGKKDVIYLHESLTNALKTTYGYPLYDESLLILAKDVAGWELNDADKLRKLTKEKGKNPEKVKKWHKEFIEGAVKSGVNEIAAEKIWTDIIEPYGKYSFNKSLCHSERINTYTSDGVFLETKNIENIVVGDVVKSRDEQSKKDIFVKVKDKHDHGVLPIVEVELNSGEKIKCTMHHKFRVEESGVMFPLWEIIKDNLAIVNSSSDLNSGYIKSIKVLDNAQTYDLEIDHKDHQFYLENGVLTSNSHAVLYSMISYQTAYLKAHYPLEFLLAYLMAKVNSNSPDADSNIEKIKKEIRAHKVKIIPPDINRSQLTYVIEGEDKLITGLDALKFVGDDAIKDIIEKRPFKNFFDFMTRTDSKKVRANSIQALAAVGALDCFNIPRKVLFHYIQDYRKKLQVWLKKHDPLMEEFTYPFPKETDWSLQELYALEHFYLGESFSCKPYQAYDKFFRQNDDTLFYTIKKSEDRTKFSSVRAIIRDFFEFKVKKEKSKFYGQSMIKVTLEDKAGDQMSCTIFPDRWQQFQEKLKYLNKKATFDKGLALHFSAIANSYEDEMGMIFDQLYNIAMPPATPSDLKAKKVNLKELKKEEKPELNNMFSLKEKIEDSLYNEGLIDLDEDNDY